MDYPPDEMDEFENDWEAMDAMQVDPPSSIRLPPVGSSKMKTPSRTVGHTVSRERRRSDDTPVTKPRWTPYPTQSSSGGFSGTTPLRTENERSSQLTGAPGTSGTCASLEMDGFEIAPSTAKKLDRYRWTPSPEKGGRVVPLPGIEGAIDLTEGSPVKSGDGGQVKDVGEKWKLPIKQKTANDSTMDVFITPSAAATTSKDTTHPPDDPDTTVVAETPDLGKEKPAAGKEAEKEAEAEKEEEKPLSAEQQKVLDMVMAGESLFFTGSAGTGKSFLLKQIIDKLRKNVTLHKGRLTKKKVAVTASTGIAGVSIGGVTLHSWAGIGIQPGDAATLVKKMKREDSQRKMAYTAYKRWNETDVLIIDEISMIDGRFWDKLEEIGRLVRGSKEPLGGIQLVLCGDFFQLPPVPDRHDRTSVFAFQAKMWNKCIPKVFALTQVFRQKAGCFVQMLNEARTGTLSAASSRKFAMLARPVIYNDGIEATELYPIKRQAEDANQRRLNALSGTTEMHKTEGSLHNHEAAVKLLDQYCKAPAVLELKVGSQVMLITNIKGGEGGLYNGSLGKIIGFEREAAPTPAVPAAKPKVETLIAEQEDAKATKQEAAFATGGWDTDEEDEEEPKLPPVVVQKAPEVNPKGVPLRRWDVDNKLNLWPLVKFTNGQEMLVKPFDFELSSAKGTMEAKRIQVPLINSWAISIHKSQGMTLPRMKVDLAQSFEKGQAYVALSRATSMDTIEVRNFHPTKVFAHPTVIEWSKRLRTVT